jgi:hypothetical protein
MPAAHRRMRPLNARSPTAVVSVRVPQMMGSSVSCRGPPHPAPRPHIEAVVYSPPHYTLVRVGLNSRHIRQFTVTVPESPSLYSRQAETQSPEFSPLPVPPPRRAGRRSQPTPTRAVWCTPLPPPYAPLRSSLHHPAPINNPV